MGKKKKILLIDDERAFTEVLRLNLEAAGRYDVEVENNAVNAVSTAMKCRPDLILMDVVMTNRAGADLAAQFEKSSEFKQIPIVFLTAAIRGEKELTGCPVVPKPTDLSVLLSVLEENLSTDS